MQLLHAEHSRSRNNANETEKNYHAKLTFKETP